MYPPEYVGYRVDVKSCASCNHRNKIMDNFCDLHDCGCASYRSVCKSYEVRTW